MDIQEHKCNLEKYIEEDMAFREPIKNMSDFDKYCYNHCLDIKTILAELDKKDRIINNAKQWIDDTMNDSNVIGCNLGDLQLLLSILEE